jgi:tyrosine-protein kinase Etk/Wzc
MSERSPADGNRWGEPLRPIIFEYAGSGLDEYGSGRPGSGGAPDDTIGLGELLSMLRRRAWLVLACVALGAALALYLYVRQEPSYAATAVISVEDPRRQVPAELGGYDSWAYAGWVDPLRSTLEALNSGIVLGRIVDQEGLRLLPAEPEALPPGLLAGVEVGEFALPDSLSLTFSVSGVRVRSSRSDSTVTAPYGERVQVGEIAFQVPERPAVPEATFVLLSRDGAIRALGGGLATEPRPETNVVDVTYTAADPALAQRVVNRAVLVFQEHSSAEARGESQRRRAFLDEQLQLADTTLRAAQADLAAFRSREQVVSTQAQGVSEQTGLLTIEMRREELRADRRMYQSILGGMATAEPGQVGERLQAIVATPEVAANPVVSALHAQLMALEQQKQELTSGPWGRSERNPDVARLTQQIATTQGRLEAAVRSHMEILDARLQAMDELRDRSARQLAGRPETLAEEERLIQNVEAIRGTVALLREEFYRARMSEAIEEGSVRVLGLAGEPSPTRRAQLPVMLALGILLGGLVGSGGAFMVEILNTKVRRQADVEAALKVGTVGVIPRIPVTRGTRRPGKQRKRTGVRRAGAAARKGAAAVAQEGGDPDFEVITIHDGRSSPAEAFRTLRTNLLYRPAYDRVRSLVVGSAMAGEGKTITAANLAVAMAQQGLRVILVDCDLRKPRLDELFGIGRKPGVTELVMGEATMDEAVRPLELVQGLYILPAGTLPPNPTELVGGARMRELLRVLREQFDMVILDSPPLAGGADSAILGAASDGVILVVRAGETDTEAVRHAARQLHAVGARLVGAVVNDPDGEVRRHEGYYYHYGYYGKAE